MIFEPVSYYRYKDLRWRLPTTTDHVRDRSTLQLTRGDLRMVSRISPICFLKVADKWNAVLLNLPGHNEVASFDDRWSGYRLPALAALYPFTVVWQEQHKKWVLGVARDPAIVGEEGEALFTPEGPITRRLLVVYRRLCIVESERASLHQSLRWLEQAGALVPVPALKVARQVPYVIRVDRIAKVLSGYPTSLQVELMMAGAFSLAQVPVAIRSAIEGYQPHPFPRTPSVAPERPADGSPVGAGAPEGQPGPRAQPQPQPQSAPAPQPVPSPEPAQSDPGFFADEDDSIHFTFSGRDGLFNSG